MLVDTGVKSKTAWAALEAGRNSSLTVTWLMSTLGAGPPPPPVSAESQRAGRCAGAGARPGPGPGVPSLLLMAELEVVLL